MTRLPTKDVLVYSKIPAEFALIYAQISLLRLKDAMDYWVTLIHSDDLGDDYLNQRLVVATIRRNYRTLKDLTSDGSSANWHRLIRDYEQTVLESERQLDLFAQQLSHKASLASLRESRAGIKHAEKGIEHSERGIQLTNRSLEQNARVKRLTQLAFVFIPLSFATSLFGMNLEIFGQGSAQIWMFVVSMVIIYVVVGILWIVFHFWTVFQAFITKVSHDNSRHNPPSANQCQSEATADPLRRSSANRVD